MSFLLSALANLGNMAKGQVQQGVQQSPLSHASQIMHPKQQAFTGLPPMNAQQQGVPQGPPRPNFPVFIPPAPNDLGGIMR